MRYRLLSPALLVFTVCTACTNPADGPRPTSGDRTPGVRYRIMSGVSMGGYGAGYLGTKYHEQFDLVGVMGGPLDWTYLSWYIHTNLMGGFLGEPGLISPFENWFEGIDDNFERDEYIELMEDMALAWGNQITYNPKSTFYPTGIDPGNAAQMTALASLHGAAACSAGLAPGSPLRLKGFADDEYNDPAAPYCSGRYTALYPAQATDVTAARNADGMWDVMPFCDGGDKLGKTVKGDVKGDGVIQWGVETPDKGVRTGLAVDCNGNGKRDQGEPVIRDFSEPYRDCGADGRCDADEKGYDAAANPDPAGDDYDWRRNPGGTEGNLRFDAGEPYDDVGLDGLAGTGANGFDYGEGNGTFDYNPHRKNLDAKDPTKLLAGVDFAHQRYYIDGGVKDTFFFNHGAERFAGELRRLGQDVGVYNGFAALSTDQTLHGIDWARLPQNLLVLYGDPNLSFAGAELIGGDGGHVGTPTQVVQRIMVMFHWFSHALPDGDFEPTADLAGYAQALTSYSAILNREMTYGVSVPPDYCTNPEKRYPVVYFLHGYGMDPAGTVDISYLLNLLMANGRLQKMIVVYPDGQAIRKTQGSFFVNHADDSDQDPFRYEDYYMQELVPLIDAKFRTKGGAGGAADPFYGCER
jgi:S-formylglutathione hydrolase FrmB